MKAVPAHAAIRRRLLSAIVGPVILAALAASCGRKEEAGRDGWKSRWPGARKEQVEAPEGIKQLGPHAEAEWVKRMTADLKLRPYKDVQYAKDRAELVRPAPPGFRPEPVRRKARATLTLAKTELRKDEKLRYKLELQNIGSAPLTVQENFFKQGGLMGLAIHFYLVGPDGKGEWLSDPLNFGAPGQGTIITFPKGMSKEEQEEAIWLREEKGALEVGVYIDLAPGESIMTRPDQPPVDAFRTADTEDVFDRPGIYRLKFVYDRLFYLTFHDPPSIENQEKWIRWYLKIYVNSKRKEAEEDYKEYRDYYAGKLWPNDDSLLNAGMIESNEAVFQVLP